MLGLNLFLGRSEKMEAKLRESDLDLQNMQAVLAESERTLEEKTAESDARQAEIRDLDGKISGANDARMTGMEAVHRAENAAREVQERRDRRGEDRARITEELTEAEERIAELDALAASSLHVSYSRRALRA